MRLLASSIAMITIEVSDGPVTIKWVPCVQDPSSIYELGFSFVLIFFDFSSPYIVIMSTVRLPMGHIQRKKS